MKNVYGKDIEDNTRLTRHYQDWEVELAKPNKDYITTDYFCPKRDISYDDCLNKLGPLEDIEDELGIGLLGREKALQNGAWYKSHSRGIVFCPFVRIVGKGKALELKEGQRTPTLCAKTCDYGKTWALTKDELE